MSRAFKTPVGNEGLYLLDTAAWRDFRPVIDKEKCTNCGICMSYCPVMSIVREGEKEIKISYTQCKGCGLCAVECPKKAIEMKDEGGFVNG